MKCFAITVCAAYSRPNWRILLTSTGTDGLGKQTIFTLAKHSPEHIFFTGRNRKAAEDVITQYKSLSTSGAITFVEADQLSMASLTAAAKEILSKTTTIDVFIANAGIMATNPGLSPDGYENQFVVNFVAHALFVRLFLPVLEKTAASTGDARVIFLTSTGFSFSFPGGVQFDALKTKQDAGLGSQWARYGQSKLADLQFTAVLARRHPSLISISLHPGIVGTNLITSLNKEEKDLVHQTTKEIVEPVQGVWDTCWCATTKKSNLENGQFYVPVGQIGEQSKESADEGL